MNPTQVYLETELKTCSHYELTPLDKENIQKKGIEVYIYGKITSNKFRKMKVAPACEARVRKAIHQAVVAQKPIQFVHPAGGYKLWSYPSFPKADWAEYFNIAYLLKYASSVAAAYTPGVCISYYLFTYLMQKSNNLSKDEVDAYVSSFRSIVEEFLKYIHPNVTIKIVCDSDFYDADTYFNMLEGSPAQAIEQYNAFPPEKKEKYRKSSKINIHWNGKKDWAILDEREKEEKIYQGALYEVKGNIHNFPKIQDWVNGEDKIIIFPQGKNEFVGIGSTKSSIVKHWVGFGVLEKKGDRYKEIIVSPSQFELIKNNTHEVVLLSFMLSSNLKEIGVYTHPIFSRQDAP